MGGASVLTDFPAPDGPARRRRCRPRAVAHPDAGAGPCRSPHGAGWGPRPARRQPTTPEMAKRPALECRPCRGRTPSRLPPVPVRTVTLVWCIPGWFAPCGAVPRDCLRQPYGTAPADDTVTVPIRQDRGPRSTRTPIPADRVRCGAGRDTTRDLVVNLVDGVLVGGGTAHAGGRSTGDRRRSAMDGGRPWRSSPAIRRSRPARWPSRRSPRRGRGCRADRWSRP